MNDGIMENYGNIEWLYGRSAIHLKRIETLENKIEMLDARVLKLEEIIVGLHNTGMWDTNPIKRKVEYEGTPILEPDEEFDSVDEVLVNAEHLCNDEDEEEPHYSIEDLAEIALEQRANEDRGEDR